MNGPRVLILECDPNARSALAELLRDAGYDVATASTKEAALSAFDADHPDILLVHVGKGCPDGFDLAREVRAHASPPLVAFMSSEPAEYFSWRSGETKHTAWFAKPIDLGKLLATLGRLTAAA